jgi:predicted amidophosphoribosyltransferase
MRCAQCSVVVAQDDRFCGDCGAPVEVACPSCGEPLAAGKRFCRACGSPVQAAAASSATAPAEASLGAEPVAERRVCSVLFCDVVGFTPLS